MSGGLASWSARCSSSRAAASCSSASRRCGGRRSAGARATARAEEELWLLLAGLTPSSSAELARAFAAYFLVVNMAEKVHRIRRRREYQRRRETQSGSLVESAARLRDAGVGPDEIGPLLARLRIEPVFTAHPSQATRRTILEKQQRIAQRLVERLDPSLTPAETEVLWARLRAEVTSAWQTEEQHHERPTVADEMEHVLFYLTDIVYPVVPMFYETLEEALGRTWGEAVPPARCRRSCASPPGSAVTWTATRMSTRPPWRRRSSAIAG